MGPKLLIDLLIGGAILGAVYSLVAAGLNLQYGVTRILNVAHGEFLMVGAYLTYFCFTLFHMNPFASVAVIGPLMFLLGLFVYRTLLGRVVVQSTAEELEFRSLLLCFGLSFVIQNLAIVVWTANYRSYRAFSLGTIEVLGAAFEAERIIVALISMALNIFLYLFLKLTRVGLAMRAAVDQPQGTQIVGVDVFRICAISFSLSILLASLAGTLISILYSTISPFMGTPYTIIALVLVILAGIGSFKGNILGGFIFGYLSYVTMRVIHPSLTLVVLYGVLIVILLIRPTGLFAR